MKHLKQDNMKHIKLFIIKRILLPYHKSLMTLFPEYTLITGKPKKECVCNPSKGGDGICKC